MQFDDVQSASILMERYLWFPSTGLQGCERIDEVYRAHYTVLDFLVLYNTLKSQLQSNRYMIAKINSDI